MANNCLVTKLKGEVDNNKLPYVGEFLVSFGIYAGGSTNGISQLWYRDQSNITLRAVEGSFENIDHSQSIGTEYTAPTRGTFGVAVSSNAAVYIPAKYDNIQRIILTSDAIMNIDDLQYSEFDQITIPGTQVTGSIDNIGKKSKNLRRFDFYSDKITGSINSLFSSANTRLNRFVLECPNVTGDLSSLATISSTDLGNFTIGGTKVTGVLSDLGTLTSITGIGLYSSTYQLATTGITGSIEDLATAQIAAGRTSGTLAITSNGVITYNGEAVPANTEKTITFNGSSYTVA